LPSTIIDRENITIRSSEMEINVPVDRLVGGIRVKFWEPYISNNALYAYQYEEYFNILNEEGAKIEITTFNAKYSSDSFYFCQSLQMISNRNECIGGEVAEFVTGDDQFNYICNADSKKIGPEPTWGAFYSQDSCEFSCVMHKECIPTYRHYTSYGTEDFMYKAEVGCVDEPGNNNCSDAVCKALFADTEERPLNEILVANDDSYIYTVRNKVLQDHPRPKIDLAAELGGSVDYDQTFQNEEKDAAYLHMLDNMSFNRIQYRVGTPSPVNIAYVKENSFGRSAYSIDLKPNSFHFDDGNTYYIYSVMRLLHSYTPVAGVWHLDGSMVTATETNIQFEDISYAIKTGENPGDWRVFRREEFAKYLVQYPEYTLNENGTFSENLIIDWVNTGQYKRTQFAFYNEADNGWSTFSSSQQADFFTTQQFSNAQDYYRYLISDWIERDILETPGLIVKDQRPIAHDTSFEKLYNVPIHHVNKSNSKNYTLYLVYSEQPLSYHELMVEIEGDNYETEKISPDLVTWGGYDLINSRLFRSDKIKYDGELNNNIDTLIMGEPERSSVTVNWSPAISEKGKKVFKFIFLYDDQEPNPFEYSNDDGTDPEQIQN
jgi:hypothetical protein